MPGGVEDLLIASERFGARRSVIRFSGLESFEGSALLTKRVADVERVVVGSSEQLRGVVAPAGLELVENGVILVQVAELVEEVIVELDDANGPSLVSDVPDLHGQVVSRNHHTAAGGELDVADGSDQLLEEAANLAILVLEGFCLLLAQGSASQVAHTNDSFAARVDELVAVSRMQIRASDDLREFVHVVRLDVDRREGLVLDSNVP